MRRFVLGERPPWWLWGASLLLVYFYFAAETSVLGSDWGFPLDDSWIHMQFARNLAAGDGLTFNSGEPSTGSTAPLWTALVSLLFFLPGNVVLWVKLAGTLCYLGVIAATWSLGRELGLSPHYRLVAAVLTMATTWMVWSALSGMEVPLFTWLSLAGMTLHLRERRDAKRPPLSLAVLAAAALARPEGLLLLALAVADRLLLPPRDSAEDSWRVAAGRQLAPLGWGLLLAAFVLVPAAWAYHQLGGSPLPSTFGAKAWPERAWLPDLRYIHVAAGIFFKPQPWLLYLAGAGFLLHVRRLGTDRDSGLLPALWVVGFAPIYSLLTPPGMNLVGNFGRYYFPLFPPLAVLGALALEDATRGLAERLRWRRSRLVWVGLGWIVLLAPTLWVTWKFRDAFYATNVRQVHESDVRMARWAATNLPADALVAVVDIGAFKFFAPQPVVDLMGLVSPDIREAKKEIVRATEYSADTAVAAVLEARRPDFALVFTNFRAKLFGDPSRFEPLVELQVPGNITMGGETLVLYRTPWCRYPRTKLELTP